MKQFALLFMLFFFVSQSNASRVLEIEDYYSKKTTDFIKLRFPRTAFSVYVEVETGDGVQKRKLSGVESQVNLPYLDGVASDGIGFWDRKDISLGTLISYVKRVSINVDIDQDFSVPEMDLFKIELYKHLKLSEKFDRIEVKEKQWAGQGYWALLRPYSFLLFGFLVLAVLSLFFIFHSGVNRLVRGLAQPLSELGRSAENVANSAGMVDFNSSKMSLNMGWADEQVSLQNYEKAKTDIQNLIPFLTEASAELMAKLEELGESDPGALGAIFQDIPIDVLKKIVIWAKGDWWRQALTEVAPLSQKSLLFLNEINQVRIRQALSEEVLDKTTEDLKKVLNRLEVKDFGKLLQGKSFQDSKPFLQLLSQKSMIEVGKYLYPGDWAELLRESHNGNIGTGKEKNAIYEKTLQICPLRGEAELMTYFKDADLISLLNRSTTLNEREIYRVLPEDSWVRRNRTPFYKVFEGETQVLESLAASIPLEIWDLGL